MIKKSSNKLGYPGLERRCVSEHELQNCSVDSSGSRGGAKGAMAPPSQIRTISYAPLGTF